MLLERRTRDIFGKEGFFEKRVESDSSWERKAFPTPPAPKLYELFVQEQIEKDNTNDCNVDFFEWHVDRVEKKKGGFKSVLLKPEDQI